MNASTTPDGMIRAASGSGTTEGYMPGFGNDFETEALADALPQGMNSPQKCNYGLYGEQLSGTAFTAPSHQNERTWCYRIRPSVKHSGRYKKTALPYWKSAPNSCAIPATTASASSGVHILNCDAWVSDLIGICCKIRNQYPPLPKHRFSVVRSSRRLRYCLYC